MNLLNNQQEKKALKIVLIRRQMVFMDCVWLFGQPASLKAGKESKQPYHSFGIAVTNRIPRLTREMMTSSSTINTMIQLMSLKR